MTIGETLSRKFIALDEDKCHPIYKIAVFNTKTIIEPIILYGVSAVVLDLALASNFATSEG